MGGGKAHDTALLCKWLGWELGVLDRDSVATWFKVHVSIFANDKVGLS